MENSIQIFNNPAFGQIRITHDAQGEPLFCLTDVCKILELRAPDVKRRLDDAVVSNHTVKDSLGRKNLMSFVNEDGLYDAILDSRKPEAKAFRKWVTSEVLPQIRKTGGYIPVTREDDEKTILCKALHIMQNTVALRDREIAEKKQKIAELAPLADYADQVLLSPKCYTMTEIAKFEGMTVQHLQHLLHELRIIYRSPSGPFMLYADHLDKGYEAYRTRKGCDLFGNVLYTNTYLVWTEQGRKFIHDYLKCPFVNEIA